MIDVKETIFVDIDKVSCLGEGGALGHPLIYLDLSPKGEVVCPYCSRHFVLKETNSNR